MEKVVSLNIRPEAIANRVIDFCVKNNIDDITNLKIQKLLYYAYAYYYKKYNKILFNSNNIMFWEHGPVTTIVYHSLKHFKYDAITEFIKDRDNFHNIEHNDFKIINIPKETHGFNEILSTIDFVVKKLGSYSGSQLRNMTHSENSVWYKITNNGQDFDEKFLHESDLSDLAKEVNFIQ